MDRVDEWRLFAEVAGARSFRAAARTHRVSPQAVTRAIAALEARLGRRLLNRTTRSVSLTDAGARYLERCRRLLADVDALDAGEEVADLAGGGRRIDCGEVGHRELLSTLHHGAANSL